MGYIQFSKEWVQLIFKVYSPLGCEGCRSMPDENGHVKSDASWREFHSLHVKNPCNNSLGHLL